MCVCFTRKFRVTEAGPPGDVQEAFKKYAEGGTHMTAEQLRRFLLEVQGDGGASISDAEKVVEQVLKTRHHLAMFTRHTLTLDDFHHYLFSSDLNPPINYDQVCIKSFLLVSFSSKFGFKSHSSCTVLQDFTYRS